MQAFLISLALSIVACCGDGGDSLADEMSESRDALVITLKSIDSPESATAAVPKLNKIMNNMKALGATMQLATGEREKAEQEEAMKTELMRLMTNPEIAGVLIPVFAETDTK